jgi:hypothetical protein
VEEVDDAIAEIRVHVERLRGLSPRWQMQRDGSDLKSG